MEINTIQKNNWNAFVMADNGSFLQSFEWGQLQEKLGNKVFYLKEGSAIALVIKHRLPFGLGSYLYIPYGNYFKEIDKVAEQEKSIFLRVEPKKNFDILKFQNVKISPVRLQPQKTLLLDLKPSEKEILENFPKATRYSIRTAEKKGVVIEFQDAYTPEFYKLLLETADKAKFTPHTEEHYERFFDISNTDFKVKMCLAKYQGKMVAASIMIMFGGRATYLHATSDKSLSSLQAPTFLIWEQIKLAKRNSCLVFDLWGIDEKKWPGVTNFKKSFGGGEVEYPQTIDIIYKKICYLLYRIVKKIK